MEVDYKRLFKNTLDVVESCGFYKAVRFTEKQVDSYKARNAEFSIESSYCSGVCIEFISNSKFVKFDFKTGVCNQTFANFDVFIDDKYASSISYNVRDNTEYKFEFGSKIQGEKKYTIYFPHSADPKIINFDLDEKSSFNYNNEKKDLLLCFGDSITQGYVSHFPKTTYPVMLSRMLNMSLLNQGLTGFEHNKDFIDKDLNVTPSLITTAFGTNDWDNYDSIDEISTNITLYFEKLNSIYPDIPIFVITPLWRGSYMRINPSGTFFDIISIIVKEALKYDNCTIIDGMELVPHNKNYFGSEVLHPTERGFEFYANNLFKHIKEKLDKKY